MSRCRRQSILYFVVVVFLYEHVLLPLHHFKQLFILLPILKCDSRTHAGSLEESCDGTQRCHIESTNGAVVVDSRCVQQAGRMIESLILRNLLAFK